MKNLSLTFILIALLLQTVLAQNSQKNKIEGARIEVDYQKLGLLKNTDNFSFIQKVDSIIILYKYFTVTKKLDCTSEDVSIYKKNNIVVYNNSCCYFIGIKNDRYAIFDEGTSNTRGLMVYDLLEEREVLNLVYYLDLKIENNSIYFDAEVKIKDENLKPKCPPEIEDIPYKIYLEKQYFSFQDLKVIHTGIYTCSFVE